MPTISVIVPVYKVEPYIHQCIDSILAQTYTDFELILVDDGSPDNCGMICDEYAKQDDRIRVIHQENQGASAARNAGIEVAKGDYIAFIDGDDIVARWYFDRLYSVVYNWEADIAVCKAESGTDAPFLFGEEDENSNVIAISGRSACRSIYYMDGIIPIQPWGKIYKKRLFEGIKFPEGMICEDDATIPRLLYLSSKVALVNSKIYFYRQQPNSVMNSKFYKKRFYGVRAVGICIDFFNHVGDAEMADLARKAQLVIQSKIVVQAYKNNAAADIPSEYKMGKIRALKNIYGYANDDVFTWYLTQLYPKAERPYAYLRKIMQICGFKKIRPSVMGEQQ